MEATSALHVAKQRSPCREFLRKGRGAAFSKYAMPVHACLSVSIGNQQLQMLQGLHREHLHALSIAFFVYAGA
jgi:hypothetical protein